MERLDDTKPAVAASRVNKSAALAVAALSPERGCHFCFIRFRGGGENKSK